MKQARAAHAAAGMRPPNVTKPRKVGCCSEELAELGEEARDSRARNGAYGEITNKKKPRAGRPRNLKRLWRAQQGDATTECPEADHMI